MGSGARAAGVLGVVSLTVAAVVHAELPALGAGGLLHPGRRLVMPARPAACDEAAFLGAGVTLRGWRCRAGARSRGTIVYLHGIADNRGSAAGVIERFGREGFDVIAYDSRAHGESDGDTCTYGYYEKHDLRRVIDTIEGGPVVLIGTSLGAAVALQEAADDPRVTAVIAAETFSDLRTVATDRAPFVFTRGTIDRAFLMAEQQSGMRVDDVSPVRAARRIHAPAFIIHGAADVDTLPSHSVRVYDALNGAKRLLLVPGAHHNESLNGVWNEVVRWLEMPIG